MFKKLRNTLIIILVLIVATITYNAFNSEFTKTNILNSTKVFEIENVEVEVVGDGLLESDASQLNNIQYVKGGK